MKHYTRTFESLLSDARKNCSDTQLQRYVSERKPGHTCNKCWRCACAIVLREKGGTK